MEITKEKLEAYLFSQPDSREWMYGSVDDCFLCSFIKETSNLKEPLFGGETWLPKGLKERSHHAIPEFAIMLLSETKKGFLEDSNWLMVKNLKVTWRKLFTESQTVEKPQAKQATL